MLRKTFALLTALTVWFCLPFVDASAVEVEWDGIYCFQPEDFAGDGICVLGLDDPKAGKLMLGSREIVAGDVLTREQTAMLTFLPNATDAPRSAKLQYLPIGENVRECSFLDLKISGKVNQPPVNEDFAVETYKNLELRGKLKAADPEGKAMTYNLTRQPKRGEVTIDPDGSFTYTPKKNKVGVDSFRFTATDEAGNMSREATVTITILKPSEHPAYADTAGRDCSFAAEWMKHTGIFVGETLDGRSCFHPDQTVSRSEFLVMLTGVLGLEPEENVPAADTGTDVPAWLQPYVNAALRAGITAGLPSDEAFSPGEPITGAEAAVMLQNVLDQPVPTGSDSAAVPAWAADAVSALSQWEINPEEPMTREDVVCMLYRLHQELEGGQTFLSLG